MCSFTFIIIAIFRFRFVFIATAFMRTLYSKIFIATIITIIIIIIIIIIKTKTEQEKRTREEREEREGKVTYLSMRGHKLLLTYTRFEAFFYTICPRGHQRSQI